ncbi:MAG TPA: cellulose synthase [Actinomycetota bacterium]|jgi:hypothetical protein|nr:cellulose synthase [Actinomycetota bacterium]
MSGFNQVAWFPLCAGLTGFGLVASWLAWRRRGVAAGMRGAAWSLLPLAAYLTGAVEMLWRIGTAVADWVAGFVFSPRVWSGVVVVGLAVVLFLLSGALRRRAPSSARAAQGAPSRQPVPPADRRAMEPARKNAPATPDDEFAEVEEILRRRGIS